MGTKNPVAALGSPPASAEEFKVHTAKPDVRFLSKAVQPPSQLYVEQDDVLEVHVTSENPGEFVTFNYRLLRFDGEVIKGQFIVFPVANGGPKVFQEPLAAGFFLSVSCKANSAIQRGQTFVRAFLADPVLGTGQPTYMLMADYVTNQAAPGYPFGRIATSLEGPGGFANAVITPPPIGTDFLFTVGPTVCLKITSMYLALVTDFHAATRLVKFFQFQDGANVFIGSASASCPGSITRFYGGNGGSPWADIASDQSSIPYAKDVLMKPGDKFGTVTENIQVGDQWAVVNVGFELWIQNA
jgi:hypothetical protein